MIEVEALEHGFADRTVLAVSSWQVEAGENCLVIGRSGSGKSTLLHLLAGLAAPRAGTVGYRTRTSGSSLAPRATAFAGAPWGSCSRRFTSSTR